MFKWCYKLFKVLYFPARLSRTSATGGHLDRPYRELYVNGGGRFGNPEASSLGGTFESNYKMAASDGDRSISMIMREKDDSEQSINDILDCN